MTSPPLIDMDLAKLLSQIDLREVQSQALTVNKDCFQRLNSVGGFRPDGRRLLGRSMTTTTTPSPRTHVTTFFSDGVDDTPGEMSEVFRPHRKLDRSVSEPHPNILSPRNGSQSAQCSSSSTSSSSSRYKTELCRPFEENGSCKYGEKCQFAHGRQELRTVARHPKYKTDLCKTYHTTGLCPYGPRCHFIHNDDERYLNLVNRYLLQQQMNDSLIEKTQLLQQQQVIAAALAAQKSMLHQQQQPNGTTAKTNCSVRQISATDGPASIDQWIHLPFVQSDQIRSSVSDSSSLTGSPTPSPTSSMLSDDPTAAVSGASGFGTILQTPTTQASFGFNALTAKLQRITLQEQQQQQQLQQQQLTADAMENSLQLLMAKLQQREQSENELDALISFLIQKNNPSTALTTTSNALRSQQSAFANYSTNGAPYSPPPPPPPLFSGADYSTSRDTTCFSFAYPTVEL